MKIVMTVEEVKQIVSEHLAKKLDMDVEAKAIETVYAGQYDEREFAGMQFPLYHD